jgi:hypothetical protein
MKLNDTKPKTASKSIEKARRTGDSAPAKLKRVPKADLEMYRAEGIGRRGVIGYVKIVGIPGQGRITGAAGLRVEVGGRTVQEALRRARRDIPFRPVVVKRVGVGGADLPAAKTA